ncbi:MAG: transposase, partial [Planctomyces sp.]
MARLARVEVFAADEVAIVHVMNRTVRRCFLLGYDPVSGRNYDHRKVWIDEQLVHQAKHFGIDLLCQAIMANHLHLVLRSRPDVVQEWNSEEVARRWLMLCPERRDENRRPLTPTEFEINRLVNNKEKLAAVRSRLSDVSWWMRLLCQNIAQRANREDGEVGKFWQARYRAVRLLDEVAILSCAAYVDLNPIRAAMAQTIANSDFTSAQKRSLDLAAESQRELQPDSTGSDGPSGFTHAAGMNDHRAAVNPGLSQHLAPVELKERDGHPGPDANRDGVRCSNKGFQPISTARDLSVLEWTVRQQRAKKAGRKPKQIRRL